MLRSLLLFTLLCTCGPAQIFAQFTFSVNAGYSFGSLNHQPELIGNVIQTDGSDFLKATNSATAGLEINYVPPTNRLSWGLQINYSRRGYGHFIKQDGTVLESVYSIPSHADFLDIAPRLSYRLGRLFSASIGPYASMGRKFEDNPFVIESERTTMIYDYGFKVEGRLHFGRAYVYTAYQRSLHNYDFTEILDDQFPSDLLIQVKRPSPISSLLVGVGYTIFR